MRIRTCLTYFLLIFFVLAIGTTIATIFFVSETRDFNYRDLLNIDRRNVVEQKVQDEVTKRVVVLEENAVIDVIEKTSPAVVSIVAETRTVDPFRGRFYEEEQGIGTGFLVADGYVFTNRHVVEQDLEYTVILNDGETTYSVTDINLDPLNDFAILRIDSGNDDLPQLNLGNSDNLKVGQTVIAIGNALGEFKNTASKGIISGIGREIFAGTGFGAAEYLDNVIQTDAALNPGNSGGPLLDLDGNVIAINVARAGADNIGFAIPINSIKSVYESFLEVGEIQRPYLGIEYRLNTEEASKINRAPIGAIVTDVLPNTAASKAGLEESDIITKIDGTNIDADNTLARIIATKKVNQTVTLTVDRGGDIIELKATLESAE